jgi:hypothetical protein
MTETKTSDTSLEIDELDLDDEEDKLDNEYMDNAIEVYNQKVEKFIKIKKEICNNLLIGMISCSMDDEFDLLADNTIKLLDKTYNDLEIEYMKKLTIISDENWAKTEKLWNRTHWLI